MRCVLVIDDHPIVLRGCRQLLERAGVREIVQAQSVTEGFHLYRTQKPDVIVVDLTMRTGTLNGLSFIRRLRLHDRETPLLVFTMHSDPIVVSRAFELGTTGYVLKDSSPDEFVKALKRVRDGKLYISQELAAAVAVKRARERTNPLRNLTLRELQTLALIAEGKPYGIIALDLNVGYKTVANTCSRLKAKLGANTLAELMRLAIEHLPSLKAGYTAPPSERQEAWRDED